MSDPMDRLDPEHVGLDPDDVPCGRYPEGWESETWQQGLEEHPMFMTKSPEEGEELPPLVEAMRQLKYDPEMNTATELATTYKEDGNANFKIKKYKWAIASYTTGIKKGSDDKGLNSVLFGNRSAAHFRLSNFRSALNDALEAIKLDENNLKAIQRAADCLLRLKEFEKCVEFCRKYSERIAKLKDLEKEAALELKKRERDDRRQETQERKEERKQQEISEIVTKRGVKFTGSLFKSLHPGAQGFHVAVNDGGELVWPVIFIYPEHGQTDFIEQFNENRTFQEHLKILFGDESNRPNWDVKHKYHPHTITIAYQCMDSSQMIRVDPKATLKKIVSSAGFVVVGGNPTFVLTACIKPIEKKADGDGLVGRKKVEVSLTDCLACSGCVTSAETILVNQQSHEELFRVLTANKLHPENAKVVVVSLSHQSIASIGAKYGLSFQESAEKLASFFSRIGVSYIFDITLARHLSILEAQREFDEKKKESKTPIMASVCPGWVCYVEKTHGVLMVPYLSQVKSPQQIMGSLVTHFWRKQNVKDRKVYHVTVMPCYDKKLEAARSNFYDESLDQKDVDCVLSPVELEVMFDVEGVVLKSLDPRKLDSIHPCLSSEYIASHLGSGSGGYAENVFRFASREFFGHSFGDKEQLKYRTRRNRDFLEIDLEVEGQKRLSFAIVNGFRNIQTLVQRMKRKTCQYDYVEVMACPSGCLNGGAQLRADNVEEKLYDKVEELYKSLNITELPLSFSEDPIQQIYQEWFPNEEAIKKFLYTEFHVIPKSNNILAVNW